MNQHKIQLTEDGYKALQNELQELIEKRPSVVDRLSNARSMGDLSENNDYHNAKEALEFLDGRIDELQLVLKTAEVVKHTSGNGSSSQVQVGTKVKVKVGSSEHMFHIVGDWEADPKEKKISHTSPLGQALVGKNVGDRVEVAAPAGKVEYTILEVA
jgi:transcription elongation factor GreA